MDDIELEDPVELIPDNIDETDYFSPLRISRSAWKLRAGKRAADWKLRAGKRAAAAWKLRGGKRAAPGALWKLRGMNNVTRLSTIVEILKILIQNFYL